MAQILEDCDGLRKKTLEKMRVPRPSSCNSRFTRKEKRNASRYLSVSFLFCFSQLFPGNKDRNTVVKHFFRRPVVARFVKFHPVTWRAHISMRVELYGYLLGKSVYSFKILQPIKTTQCYVTLLLPAKVTIYQCVQRALVVRH